VTSDLTVTEDEHIASVVALRASNPGMKPEAIAARLGIHPATVRRYLGLPMVRQAVAEACSAALDGARLVLADSAEEMATTVAMLATAGPASAADIPVDSLRLKAAMAGLEKLEAPKGAVAMVQSTTVNITPELLAEARSIYEAGGEDDAAK
jgi:hypothetical protein